MNWRIAYIYYQFISVTGRIVGKGIPADHWEQIAERGLLHLLPQPRGAGESGRSSDLGLPRQPADPAHEEFQEEVRRLHLRAGTEPEMMWLKKGEDGLPDGGFSKPNCYHIDQFESLRPVFMKVMEYSRAMGLDMIQGDHEDAPGQLELNWMFDDVLRNADRLTTYRQVCAQVAREHGLIACFMSKPFMGVSASGCHHNISLWRGGEDKVNRLGHDPLPGHGGRLHLSRGRREHLHAGPSIDERKPGPIGLQCVGGVMEHLNALTAIGSSTVNSYRRLWDTGFWAPVFADWGYQNRTCALRISAPGRFEYRSVDSMVNPYLMAAARS